MAENLKKLSKKRQREINKKQRNFWDVDPRTKVVQNRKGKGSYNRHSKHKKSEEF